eukprot:14975222-Heterocapsa_arctica.AAC.1
MPKQRTRAQSARHAELIDSPAGLPSCPCRRPARTGSAEVDRPDPLRPDSAAELPEDLVVQD